MSTRQNILGLIFLVFVLAVAVFVLKRLHSPTVPAGGGIALLPRMNCAADEAAGRLERVLPDLRARIHRERYRRGSAG